MKKLLLLFSLFTLHYSLCYCQDTLVTRNGKKLLVTIKWVGNEVHFRYIPDTSKVNYSIATYSVEYIRYANGTKETYNPPWSEYHRDSISTSKKMPPVSFLVSGGASIPVGRYGSKSENSTSFNNPGFAGIGYSTDLSIYFPIGQHGWSALAAFDYMKQAFTYPEGILNEYSNSYYFPLYSISSNFTVNNNSPQYTNLAFLGGASKCFGKSIFSVEIRLLAGYFIFETPHLYGSFDELSGNSYNQTSSQTVNFNLSGESTDLVVFDLGLTLSQHFTKHFSINECFDFIAAGVPYPYIYYPETATIFITPTLTALTFPPITIFNANLGLRYTL